MRNEIANLKMDKKEMNEKILQYKGDCDTYLKRVKELTSKSNSNDDNNNNKNNEALKSLIETLKSEKDIMAKSIERDSVKLFHQEQSFEKRINELETQIKTLENEKQVMVKSIERDSVKLFHQEQSFERQLEEEKQKWAKGQIKTYEEYKNKIKKLEARLAQTHTIPLKSIDMPSMPKNMREICNSRSKTLTKYIDKFRNVSKLILRDIKKYENYEDTTLYQCVKKVDDFISTSGVITMHMDEITSEQIERVDLDSMFDGLADMKQMAVITMVKKVKEKVVKILVLPPQRVLI